MSDTWSAFPASFAQRRLWFLQTLSPASTAYNMVFWTEWPAVPPGTLQSALDDLVARHESLRTAFFFEDGEPQQQVFDSGSIALDVVDCAKGADEFAAALGNSARRPFDLSRAPLARVHLGALVDGGALLGLVVHHIVADGQSIRILVEDLDASLRARLGGRPLVLRELGVQYADFAVWQRRNLTRQRLDRLSAYWKERLSGLGDLELHRDHHPTRLQPQRGEVVPFALPVDLVRRLRALASSCGTTLFASLLAGFSAVLARFTGQSSFGIGVPVSGRPRPELERVCGLFVNSMVFRPHVALEATFSSLVQSIGQALADDLTHQEMPFELLVESLGHRRSGTGNPLFQVMFQLQAASGGASGERTSRVQLDDVSAQLDLSFIQAETGAGTVEGGAVLAADLFAPGTIRQIVDAYVALLDAGGREPTCPVGRLPILNLERRAHVLALGEGERRSWPGRPLLDELCADQAGRTPDAVAVESEAARLTFRELDRAANGIAHRLRDLGVGRGSVVALALPRSTGLVSAALGILKAGAAYLVLDGDSPAARREAILSDSAPAVVIGPPGGLPLAHERPALAIDDVEPTDAPPPKDASAEDAAYVIYTSGSTGEPKGVVIPHRAIVNHMRWMLETFAIGADDRVLQRTPLTFDASVWEVWAPLLGGAVLVLAPEERLFDPGRLVDMVEANRISTLQVVPSLLRALLDRSEFGVGSTLRRVFCGGEPLTADLVERFHARSSAELCNLYGPTETTIDATYHVCPRGASDDVVPIGRPIANVTVRVLDERGEVVPCGVIGELHIGGEAVGSGYLGKPGLTAERFLADPWSAGQRMYRTGDRVRMRQSGELEFLGRVDTQVKLRGFRIELGEIESVLLRHPSVREAAAVVQDFGRSDQRLVAFVTAGNGRVAGLGTDLHGWLRGRLAPYQVPSVVEVVDGLPKTAHGKVDRQALARPRVLSEPEDAPRVAPRNALERAICDGFAAVLQAKDVGIDDDFFLMGGHSLLVVTMCRQLGEAVGVEVGVVDVFEFPTPRQLGEALRARTSAPGEKAGRAEAGQIGG